MSDDNTPELPPMLTESEAAGLLSKRFHEREVALDNVRELPPRNEQGRFVSDADPEEPPPEAPEESPPETEAPEAPVEDLTSLRHLAEAYDVDVDDVLALTHEFGEDKKPVSVRDAYAAYKDRETLSRRRAEFEQNFLAVQQQEAQRQQQWQAFHEQMAQQLSDSEAYHTSLMSSPQMQALRTDDPEAWISQHEALQQTLADIRSKRTEANKRYQQEAAENYQRMRYQEALRLQQLIPDWTEARGQRVSRLFQELQFNPQEQHLASHNAGLIRALDELAQRRAADAAPEAKIAKKKVARRIPRTSGGGRSSGSRGDGRGSARQKEAALRKKLIESGGRDEKAAQQLLAERVKARRRKAEGQR